MRPKVISAISLFFLLPIGLLWADAILGDDNGSVIVDGAPPVVGSGVFSETGTLDTVLSRGNNAGDQPIWDLDKLGIGTATSAYGLAIHGGSGGIAGMHFWNDDTGETNNTGFFVGLDANEDAYIRNYESGEPLRFGSGGSMHWEMDSSGDFVPFNSNVVDVGELLTPLSAVYANTFYAGTSEVTQTSINSWNSMDLDTVSVNGNTLTSTNWYLGNPTKRAVRSGSIREDSALFWREPMVSLKRSTNVLGHTTYYKPTLAIESTYRDFPIVVYKTFGAGSTDGTNNLFWLGNDEDADGALAMGFTDPYGFDDPSSDPYPMVTRYSAGGLKGPLSQDGSTYGSYTVSSGDMCSHDFFMTYSFMINPELEWTDQPDMAADIRDWRQMPRFYVGMGNSHFASNVVISGGTDWTDGGTYGVMDNQPQVEGLSVYGDGWFEDNLFSVNLRHTNSGAGFTSSDPSNQVLALWLKAGSNVVTGMSGNASGGDVNIQGGYASGNLGGPPPGYSYGGNVRLLGGNAKGQDHSASHESGGSIYMIPGTNTAGTMGATYITGDAYITNGTLYLSASSAVVGTSEVTQAAINEWNSDIESFYFPVTNGVTDVFWTGGAVMDSDVTLEKFSGYCDINTATVAIVERTWGDGWAMYKTNQIVALTTNGVIQSSFSDATINASNSFGVKVINYHPDCEQVQGGLRYYW